MRIAVLSDTHDRLPDHVVDSIRDADEVWHLGDVMSPVILEQLEQPGRPLRVVRGNCDECLDWPLALEFELCGQRILLIHIPPQRAPAGIDLLFHGHTHVPRNEVIRKTRFLNPGCITRPNRGAPASYAWLELQEGMRPVWKTVLV